MSSLAIAAIVFGCCFGGALIGMVLHVKLPDHHLDGGSKEVVKLVMGLIATMAALVLGLLIASAKNTYDAQSSGLLSLSANIVQLDRLLAFYGSEAAEAREILRRAVMVAYERTWSADGLRVANLDPSAAQGPADAFYGTIQSLSPKTDAQRSVLNRAMQLGTEIQQIRLLMFERTDSSISAPFLIILVFWTTVLFAGFGILARFNGTVTVALFVGAVSVAGAIFLVLELSHPYQGIMQLSGAPLRNAIARINH